MSDFWASPLHRRLVVLIEASGDAEEKRLLCRLHTQASQGQLSQAQLDFVARIERQLGITQVVS